MYSENHNEKLKMTKTYGEVYHVLGWEESILKITMLRKALHRYSGILFKIPIFFHRIRTIYFTICIETQKDSN